MANVLRDGIVAGFPAVQRLQAQIAGNVVVVVGAGIEVESGFRKLALEGGAGGINVRHESYRGGEAALHVLGPCSCAAIW